MIFGLFRSNMFAEISIKHFLMEYLSWNCNIDVRMVRISLKYMSPLLIK